MTIDEFNKYNEEKSMPQTDIGQGFGYKADINWDTVNLKDIIYIPEYGYEPDGTVPRGNAFSKQDFLDLAREYLEAAGHNPDDSKVDGTALFVWETVDWQFPTSFMDECDFSEKWEDEE